MHRVTVPVDQEDTVVRIGSIKTAVTECEGGGGGVVAVGPGPRRVRNSGTQHGYTSPERALLDAPFRLLSPHPSLVSIRPCDTHRQPNHSAQVKSALWRAEVLAVAVRPVHLSSGAHVEEQIVNRMRNVLLSRLSA